MARVTVRLELGPGVSLGALAGVVDDLLVVHDLSVRVDAISARREAEARVEGWWRDSPGQLYEHLDVLDERASGRLRRLLGQRQEDDALARRLADAPPELWFEEWYRLRRRYWGGGGGQDFLAPSMLWQLRGSSLSEAAPDAFSQLVAREFSELVPPPPTVERLSYENPIEVVLVGVVSVLAGLGFKFGTFTDLATLIRDWSADKEQKRAQAREASAVADRAELGVRREEAEIGRTEAETREIHARASKAETETEILRRYALGGGRVDDLIEAGLTPHELQAVARLATGTVEVEVDPEGP